MGKKKAEEMAKERAGFMEGCRRNGVDDARSPAASSTSWRSSRPTASTSPTRPPTGSSPSRPPGSRPTTRSSSWRRSSRARPPNTDKVVLHISEARASGIEVLQPDVNESLGRVHRHSPLRRRGTRSAAPRGRIRFGLGAVKGVGESAVEAILGARSEGGPFKSLFDFARAGRLAQDQQEGGRGAGEERRLRLRGRAALAALRRHRRRASPPARPPRPTGRAARRASSARWPARRE